MRDSSIVNPVPVGMRCLRIFWQKIFKLGSFSVF